MLHKEIHQEMIGSHYDGPIPRLNAIRRVPNRYQHILPLEWMKRHQCTVVGAAHGVLTVAITGSQDKALIYSLERLTGRRVFAVLVEPTRMRLLIERIERSHCPKRRKVGYFTCYLHHQQLQTYIQCLLIQS